MINSVVLVGRLTKEVDLRFTSSGVAVGTFNLAVDRQFKSQSGERETDFIRCQIWRKSAENLAEFTQKGSRIGITGRIQTRSYDNAQGQKTYITEIVVETFTLLDSRNENKQPRNDSSNNAAHYSSSSTSSQEAQGNQSQQTNYSSTGFNAEINDDDLPF